MGSVTVPEGLAVLIHAPCARWCEHDELVQANLCVCWMKPWFFTAWGNRPSIINCNVSVRMYGKILLLLSSPYFSVIWNLLGLINIWRRCHPVPWAHSKSLTPAKIASFRTPLPFSPLPNLLQHCLLCALQSSLIFATPSKIGSLALGRDLSPRKSSRQLRPVKWCQAVRSESSLLSSITNPSSTSPTASRGFHSLLVIEHIWNSHHSSRQSYSRQSSRCFGAPVGCRVGSWGVGSESWCELLSWAWWVQTMRNTAGCYSNLTSRRRDL